MDTKLLLEWLKDALEADVNLLQSIAFILNGLKWDKLSSEEKQICNVLKGRYLEVVKEPSGQLEVKITRDCLPPRLMRAMRETLENQDAE